MSYLAEYVPVAKRGVVYFSSVPRDMRPPEVCLHFNKFGTILRHRFVPFPKKERRPGGPLLPLQYKEGWVEFSKAEDAKVAAAYMNTQPVECKRTRKCYGQLWSVKYLEDFSWDTLVEEREGQRRARRMAEVEARRQERDVNETYRRLVMQAQQAKRQKRKKAMMASSEAKENSDSAEGEGEQSSTTRAAAGAAAAGSAASSSTTKQKPAAHSAKKHSSQDSAPVDAAARRKKAKKALPEKDRSLTEGAAPKSILKRDKTKVKKVIARKERE